MTKAVSQFIIVDDDPINNMICEMIVMQSAPGVAVTTFMNPLMALSFIESEFAQDDQSVVILFLDINMPEISGWEFLEAFKEFGSIIKKHFIIYLLSSSIDPNDKERAAGNPVITAFIEKPLSRESFEGILNI